MKQKSLAVLVVVIAIALMAANAAARGGDPVLSSSDRTFVENWGPTPGSHEGARLETLWIFDADFEDLVGDNAGWTTYDRSGTLGSVNYWHHDTIRISGFSHLGDSTWWCGAYNECWRQPRGYGNDWMQILERHFTETVGDTGTIVLDYDQRYAMELDYDYGYTDVRSAATSDTWFTVFSVDNPGFQGTAGRSQDWNSTNPQGPGHMTLDITDYCGNMEFDLRFRFESDGAYSSQDQWNNPPLNSVQDGAWQLDNITLTSEVGGVLFYDDAESGDPWTHDDSPASGQTGVTFWRARFGIDVETGRAFTCDDRPYGSWLYAPVDPFSSTMVDDQYSWLMSPPIDISGAAKLVGSWDYWLDMPPDTEDLYNVALASNDNVNCVTDPDGFVDEEPGWWFGGPYWNVKYDDWDAFAGNDWLAMLYEAQNNDEATTPHMAGFWVHRARLGIPSGDAGTQFDLDIWNDFNDWFQEQISDALLDTAELNVADDDDVATVFVVASNDGGSTWEHYACRRENPESNKWYVPPPYNQIVPGVEIYYYYEATDGVGNTATYPSDAPARVFEFSILPLDATVSDPGILLVDKHRRRTPGENRNYDHSSQYYYREAMEILGYDYEIYEVEVESGSTNQANGPDSVGHKYYDTQIWWANRFDTRTITPFDQANLISWLNQSSDGKERNLAITAPNIGYELVETNVETLNFYSTWLATNYVDDEVGEVTVDSVPTAKEHAGGWTFMNHDDGRCLLAGGCPFLQRFDVLEPAAGIPGTEIPVDYLKLDASERPAGCAYTHQSYGYQTVNLGFGLEYMMDSRGAGGYFITGIEDRSNLLGNILEYFGKTPTGPGTGVEAAGKNLLSHAYPNPFNPVTRIAYSVREAGPVTIEVYSVAGRVVRTLLDAELEAGTSGHVVWDGANDAGERCASGVYFYRIVAPDFTTSRKMVMLK